MVCFNVSPNLIVSRLSSIYFIPYPPKQRKNHHSVMFIIHFVHFKCSEQWNLLFFFYKQWNLLSFLIFHSFPIYQCKYRVLSILPRSKAKIQREMNLYLTILYGWSGIIGFSVDLMFNLILLFKVNASFWLTVTLKILPLLPRI